MAIDSSNRSPSPIPFRQSPNPNFANSKNSMEKRGDGGLRTSANGSPFPKPSVAAHPSAWCSNSKTTPANSPSEFRRRNSFSKVSTPVGLTRDVNEHKENKKPNPNLKPMKATKNFMSPTISAVSKANPSPRKKTLAERNEAVRTSASLSDGKFIFFASAGDDDLKSETESCDFQKEEFHKKEEATNVSTCEAKKKVTFDDDVVVLSPEVTCGYDVDEPSESFDVSEMIKPSDFEQNEEKETSFVSSGFSPIAPLDADPCVLPPCDPKIDYLSPYDPKTNYLVPRPQFLRYKPDELPLYIKNLEDTLSSETSSENDEESTVEEAESEEAPVRDEEKPSQPSPLAKPGSSDESILAHEDEDEVSVESDEETDAGNETVKKPGFFRRGRMITWLLFGVVAVLAGMIASHAPPESVLSKVYHYNHADISGSLHRMKEWSTTYLPLMISSFRETDDEFTPSETDDEFTPLEFLNFSALVCSPDDRFVDRGGKVEILKTMDSDFEEMTLGISPDQQVQYFEQTEQIGLGYSGQSEEAEISKPEEAEQIEQVGLGYSGQSEEAEQIEQVELGYSGQSEEVQIPKSDDNEPELVPVAASHQHQIHFTEHTKNGIEVGLEPDLVAVEFGEVEVPSQGAVIILVATLCAASALGTFAIFWKRMKRVGTNSSSTQQADVPSQIKKEASLIGNPSHGSRLEAETYSPSEMNSYSYYSKSDTGYESEAQSKEERKQPRRNYKRESLASSSSEFTRGTESYGSFTTYSVMPTKHGDEEIFTPIRRSSRIINKAQPPMPAARKAL